MRKQVPNLPRRINNKPETNILLNHLRFNFLIDEGEIQSKFTTGPSLTRMYSVIQK